MVWAVSLLTTELIPRRLTPRLRLMEFAVWLELVSYSPPSPSRALPPLTIPEAAPQCISGRTSYHRVRLAYHPYPQLIRQLCNVDQFGPPLRFYRSFTLAMDSSPGFGSDPRDYVRPIQTCFRFGSVTNVT